MNIKPKKNLNPVGYLEVWKMYPDGTRELHWEDNNVITSGLGVGIAHLFSGSGSNSIIDYQLLNFQVGVSGNEDDFGASTFQLSSPLSTAEYQSTGSELIIEEFTPIENGSLATDLSAFGRILYTNIHKVTKTSVRFTLVIDRYSCNDLDPTTLELNEIGLFMRNPRGLDPPSPILVAYRPFTAIRKSTSFSLVFRWTLQF